MSSIFPREQRVEQLFDRILRDPLACRRLKETFYESCPETDLMDADSVEASDKIFANALIRAYQNQDLSAFLMAICGNSMFDLLRNSFLIPLRFNDKGVENPVILTDETGALRDNLPVAVPDKKYKIAGYADKATGSSKWNQKLSEARAQAVYDALVKEGVSKDQLELVGFGGTDNMFGKNFLNRVVILE